MFQSISVWFRRVLGDLKAYVRWNRGKFKGFIGMSGVTMCLGGFKEVMGGSKGSQVSFTDVK